MRLKRGANETLAIVLLASVAVGCAILLGLWQAGFFDDAEEQLKSGLQRERGSMVASGDCDGSVAAIVQNRWRKPGDNPALTGTNAGGKRFQISAELNEAVYGMDFNADGDTRDVIPRLPDRPAADDQEWADTPGGLLIGSKHSGPDVAANVSEATIPLFTYGALLRTSSAAADLLKLRDVSRSNAYLSYFWNIRDTATIDALSPADPAPRNRIPPSLPAVPIPGANPNGNAMDEALMFNAQIIVDKQAGCWAVKYFHPLEIQCADGTDTCFTGHDFEYLTSVFTEDISIVFRYPPEITLTGGSSPVGRVLDMSGRATEAGETVTCGAITGPLGLQVAIVPPASDCNYRVTADSLIHGRHSIDIAFSSSSGATRTVNIPVHISNIQFSPPDPPQIQRGGQTTFTITPTDGKFTVSCGPSLTTPASGVTITNNGCEYTIAADSTAAIGSGGTNYLRAELTSPGGDSRRISLLYNVVAPPAPPLPVRTAPQPINNVPAGETPRFLAWEEWVSGAWVALSSLPCATSPTITLTAAGTPGDYTAVLDFTVTSGCRGKRISPQFLYTNTSGVEASWKIDVTIPSA